MVVAVGEDGGIEHSIFLCTVQCFNLGSSLVLSAESSLARLRHVCGIRTVHGLSIRITLYNCYFDMCKNIQLTEACRHFCF